MRLRNIDLFKGLLILLVVLGHVLQGRIDDSLSRTIIYSFHMPLFIGVSGYLFNANKARSINLFALLKNYRIRVILPWAIAVLSYFIFHLDQWGNFSFTGLIKAYAIPYYHLWFIPGFLSWVVITWVFKKMKLSNQGILVVALLISLFSYLINTFPETFSGLGPGSSLIKVALYTFRPQFYFFFALGLAYKAIDLNKPKILEYALPLISVGLVLFSYYSPHWGFATLNFFVFNAFLINLILKIAANNMIKPSPNLEWIGLNSLGLYLWHVLPIVLCKHFVGTENLFNYYSSIAISEVLFVLIYVLLIRVRVLKKYVFGM